MFAKLVQQVSQLAELVDHMETGTTDIERLAKLPFWCYNDTLHKEKPDTYKQEGCCLTHTTGLPKHPSTGEEMPLTPYQIEMFEAIMKAVTKPDEMTRIDWLMLHHYFHILKGRQMGFTEIVLRIIQFFCFGRYAGRNVGIIAGTTGALARKDLYRFKLLFAEFPDVIASSTNFVLKLVNATVIEAFKASDESITGDTKYACIFMDEAAKWKLLDDTPVFNSILPITVTNGSDLFLVSTPKGPMKMFYKIYLDPEDFIKLEYDIWRAEGNLYTRKQIEHELETCKGDPNQEYLCKFTIGEDSVFGVITDENRDKNWAGWDDEMDDDEFVEALES